MILPEISSNLKTQDNRITAEPIFLLQIKKRDIGYDWAYSDNWCWVDSGNEDIIYSDDKDFKSEPEGEEYDQFGYIDRWETVTMCFTEAGCHRYMEINGHNVKSAAFRGEWRIYVDTLYRNEEMIEIRKFLMNYK